MSMFASSTAALKPSAASGALGLARAVSSKGMTGRTLAVPGMLMPSTSASGVSLSRATSTRMAVSRSREPLTIPSPSCNSSSLAMNLRLTFTPPLDTAPPRRLPRTPGTPSEMHNLSNAALSLFNQPPSMSLKLPARAAKQVGIKPSDLLQPVVLVRNTSTTPLTSILSAEVTIAKAKSKGTIVDKLRRVTFGALPTIVRRAPAPPRIDILDVELNVDVDLLSGSPTPKASQHPQWRSCRGRPPTPYPRDVDGSYFS